MRKPGLDYQDLVGLIESALDPGAEIKVGEWVKGPDGSRELDVSIRGSRDGKPFFAFVECKDYARKKVGVAAVDELDSKRHDLAADFVALYSNSGYTTQALRKAHRVGISTFAAVAQGDRRSRARLLSLATGRIFKIEKLVEQIFEPEGQDFEMPNDLQLGDITFDGEPVHNWIVDQLDELLSGRATRPDEPSSIVAVYQFDDTLEFRIRGLACEVVGVKVIAELAIERTAKLVPMSADLARFDTQEGLLRVPANVPMYIYLPAGQDGWDSLEEPTSEQEDLAEGLILRVGAILQARLERAPGGSPDLGPHVVASEISVEPVSQR